MNIFYYPYELCSKHTSRTGALLSINDGISCIQPWPEFGDLPLQDQLNSLKNFTPTKLAQRSIYFADIDRNARESSTWLFDNLSNFTSHHLITDIKDLTEKKFSGHNILKIKIGTDPDTESKIINQFILTNQSKLKLRLDANEKFHISTFIDFWSSLTEETKTCVEYVEDPCPYQETDWELLFSTLKVPLAYDFYGNNRIEKFYNVRVLKPLVQDHMSLINMELREKSSFDKKICITSSLDHPIGVSIAAWCAKNLEATLPDMTLTPGITSFTNYEKDAFSEQIWGAKDSFIPSGGTGFGFNSLIDKINWLKL